MSSAFVKFDERLTVELRGNVILEINKADLVENIEPIKEVVDFARRPRLFDLHRRHHADVGCPYGPGIHGLQLRQDVLVAVS